MDKRKISFFLMLLEVSFLMIFFGVRCVKEIPFFMPNIIALLRMAYNVLDDIIKKWKYLHL